MRKIIHIDMDCFYAAVEMRENPSLVGRPIAVGGSPSQRGVLSTCNYEARRYGLHSAMPSSRAMKLCPHLVLLPGRHALYREESKKIAEIFKDYTSRIEPLSLDEAYLDVSESPLCSGSATLMAKEIRERIFRERKLTASAGIAENKFLAKIASDWNKPNGQLTIPPEKSAAFAAALEIGKIPGIGQVGKKRLNALGIFFAEDILKLSTDEVVKACGSFGFRLIQFAKGIDTRPVVSETIRKSLSTEDTFERDIFGEEICLTQLKAIHREFLRRIALLTPPILSDSPGKIFVKIKYGDFSQTTIERSVQNLYFENFSRLFCERYALRKDFVRLLGLGIRLPEKEESNQLCLDFDNAF